MDISPVPQALIILDGWGYSEILDANAIQQANTPLIGITCGKIIPILFWKHQALKSAYPTGKWVILKWGILIWAQGVLSYQDFTRIGLAIKDGSFFEKSRTQYGLRCCQRQMGGAVHIMGLLSSGGVHSHEDHIIAMLELAAKKGVKKFYLHAFLDGRDTPTESR